MKVKCLYKVGDIIKVLGSDVPMLITGYVLDDNGDVVEYEIVPTDSIMYCTENAIVGLEKSNETDTYH